MLSSKPLSLSESYLSAIMTVSHHDHKPSCQSATIPPPPRLYHSAYQPLCQSGTPLCVSEIMPSSHHTYKPLCQSATSPPLQPLCQSAIMPISHHAYQPLRPPPLQQLLISAIISPSVSLSIINSSECLLPHTYQSVRYQ